MSGIVYRRFTMSREETASPKDGVGADVSSPSSSSSSFLFMYAQQIYSTDNVAAVVTFHKIFERDVLVSHLLTAVFNTSATSSLSPSPDVSAVGEKSAFLKLFEVSHHFQLGERKCTALTGESMEVLKSCFLSMASITFCTIAVLRFLFKE